MVENQALDRVHRLGQTKPVKTFRYIAKGTFDQVLKPKIARCMYGE
jgi:SNF2 family DNA or RNA helicase